MRRPAKNTEQQDPQHPTASPLPAPLHLHSSTAALEEVRIIDNQILTSRKKQQKTSPTNPGTPAPAHQPQAPRRAKPQPIHAKHTRPASPSHDANQRNPPLASDNRERPVGSAPRSNGNCAPKRDLRRTWIARVALQPPGVDARRSKLRDDGARGRIRRGCGTVGQVISSARHAGENSSMESPKAQPPEPLRQKDRVRSKSLESGTGARRRRIHRRGTPSSAVTSHTYMSADATRSRENLSGKRTDGACSVTNRTRPFLVHPDGVPSR